MPNIKDLEENRIDMDVLLHKAIDNWNPQRPRRWLAKYGGWRVEKYSALAQKYCALRDEAQDILSRT